MYYLFIGELILGRTVWEYEMIGAEYTIRVCT